MAIDVNKIAAGLNPSGIDPDIEKKADDYGRRSWKMDFEPVLTQVLKDDLTDELTAKLQQALFNHKVEMLENAQERAETNKELGKRW